MKRFFLRPITISFALFIVIVAFFTIANPSFLSAYNAVTILNAAIILLAVGLGQAFTILTGGIDLSVGSIMSLVSVVFMLTLEPLGGWAYPAVLAIGVGSGFLNGIIISKLRIPSFIATLGTQGILLSCAYLLSVEPLAAPDSASGLLNLVTGSLGPVQAVWIIGFAVFALFYYVQRFTQVGRSIVYIGANERMAYLSGLRIDRGRIAAFVLSGLGASVAGIILAATLYSGYPSLGSVYVLNSIATVVVGGTAMTGGAGGALNTLVGALIMGTINNGLTVVGVDVYAQQVFLGVLIIIAVAVTFDRQKIAIIK